MRRLTAIALCVILACGLTVGCTKQNEEVKESEASAPAVTEAVTEAAKETAAEPKETVPEEEETAAVAEYDKDFLEINVKMTDMGTHAEDYSASYAEVKFPQFSLSDECAQRYPELQATLLADAKMSKEAEEKALVELTDLAKEQLGYDAYFSKMEDTIKPEIRRADTTVLSIFEAYYGYSGGVHGYYAYWGDNFDVETGMPLTLSEVIKDMGAFMNTVREKISANYPEIGLETFDDSYRDYDGTDNNELPWTMDYSGVTVYFNPYVIGSYADGVQAITVPFAENPDLFEARFTVVPENYVQQLNYDAPALIDADGDGAFDAVFVRSHYTEYGEGEFSDYKTWDVYCGGDYIELEDYSYDGEMYLVRANKQYYLYAFEQSDNDYQILNVVDLKTMSNNRSKMMNAGSYAFDFSYDSDDTSYTSIDTCRMFTDPDNMLLATTTNCMGTMTGTKTYHIGKDGWPVSKDEYFITETGMVISPKENVKCENGELKAGKFYQVVRTDNDFWADLQEVDEKDVETYGDDDFKMFSTEKTSTFDPDKETFRVRYESNTWPKTINGKDEMDLFDGIMYAG